MASVMNNLVEEIKRQMALKPEETLGLMKGDLSSIGIVGHEVQQHDFRQALEVLHDQICGMNETSLEAAKDDFTITETSLFWKLPAFCLPTPYFIDPERIKSRLNAIRATRTSRGGLNENADDIWFQKPIQSWLTTAESRILFVQGQYPTSHRLQHFGLGMTTFLSKKNTTLCMLQHVGNMPESYRALGIERPEQILRQLAIQALQQISSPKSIRFLASTLETFQKARTCDDWSKVLQLAASCISEVFIVLDLDITKPGTDDAERLRNIFKSLLAEIQSNSPSRIWKIFLMSTRRFTVRPEPPEEVMLIDATCKLPPLADLPSLKDQLSSSMRSIKVEVRNNTRPKPSNENPQTFHGAARTSQTNEILNRNDPDIPTIAIMCALTLEADAVEALFDEYYAFSQTSSWRANGDVHSYSKGRIGFHTVVLVHLAGMGKSNATLAAANCRATFPDIKVALVVGVCGGVPSAVGEAKTEIVLGDVVISEGIIPFDFGRQYPEKFSIKDSVMEIPGRPPPLIRSLLAKLKGTVGRLRLNNNTAHYLDIENDVKKKTAYPGAGGDKLFEGTYRHKHHASFGCNVCCNENEAVCEDARKSSCEEINCDTRRLVPRTDLGKDPIIAPTIHFGLVASGDQVMKSGEHRDKIAAGMKVIAFEMEAAGVWESFPCVVIKGVCDYADSHKSKKWQTYAAATAAACMRAFLDEWT